MTRAFYIGDSNTWAQHLAPEKRWPALVSTHFGWDYLDLAQPGARSIDWMPGAASGYWGSVESAAPTVDDLLFVLLGSADTLGAWPPTWVPTSEWEYEAAMLSIAFAWPGRICMLAPPPVLDWPIFADHYPETMAALAKYTSVCRHIRDVMSRVSFVADPALFVTTTPADPELNPDFVDSVHLDEPAHLKLACTVIQAMPVIEAVE